MTHGAMGAAAGRSLRRRSGRYDAGCLGRAARDLVAVVPQRGNYDFWLRQDNNAPGGRTIPQWNVTGYPWGKYTRRTDMPQATR